MENSPFIKHAIILISIVALFSISSLRPLFSYLGVPTGAIQATAYIFLFIGLIFELGETFHTGLPISLGVSAAITLIAFSIITLA